MMKIFLQILGIKYNKIRNLIRCHEIQLRFRKAGRVWCGGTRETREPHVTIGRTVSKIETTKNLPAFQDLSGK